MWPLTPIWEFFQEYEVKIKMEQEQQWLQLKMKFVLGYSMKIII